MNNRQDNRLPIEVAQVIAIATALLWFFGQCQIDGEQHALSLAVPILQRSFANTVGDGFLALLLSPLVAIGPWLGACTFFLLACAVIFDGPARSDTYRHVALIVLTMIFALCQGLTAYVAGGRIARGNLDSMKKYFAKTSTKIPFPIVDVTIHSANGQTQSLEGFSVSAGDNFYTVFSTAGMVSIPTRSIERVAVISTESD